MPAAASVITPEYVINFETALESAVDDGYSKLQDSLWWEAVMAVRPFGAAKKKILQFNIQSAQISDRGPSGGEIEYDDVETHYIEATNGHFGRGLRLKRDAINDNAIDHAGQWANDIGGEMAYFPQKRAVGLLTNGTSALAYDGLPFFHAAHWRNPRSKKGATYKNLHTGLALNPTNLAGVVAYIRSQIKMPNGTPRFLRPRKLVLPRLALQDGQGGHRVEAVRPAPLGRVDVAVVGRKRDHRVRLRSSDRGLRAARRRLLRRLRHGQ